MSDEPDRVGAVLRGERLLLRRVRDGDIDDLVELDHDPEVRRYVHEPDAPTRGDVVQRIDAWRAIEAETPTLGYWVAEVIEAERFVGWFHLRQPRDGAPSAPGDLDLGYRLRRDAWGKGLATEGARVLIRYAFETLGAQRVIASALAENAASIRVMEKLGMDLIAEWRFGGVLPAVSFAITRSNGPGGI